jgi:hypothetical protein
MTRVTIIDEEARALDATLSDGRVLLEPELLATALGWTLKPEGLCRDDTCVPVRDRSSLFVDGKLDLVAVTDALGRPSVVDVEAGLVAVALDAEQRRGALQTLVAPPFTLPDLDGTPHHLSEWHGRKRLLHAFASW